MLSNTESSENKAMPGLRHSSRAASRGFTMIEMAVVIMIIFIIVAMTLVRLQPTLQQMRANAGMQQVMGQLRTAREMAISDRRNVIVTFIGNNTIQLTRVGVPAGLVVLSTVPIEGTVQFMVFGGVPDTPDGFGNAAPVYFANVAGGPPNMQYQSDGTFVNANGNPINGTVFLGITGIPSTARAVTVLGTTGRVRFYRATPNGWIK